MSNDETFLEAFIERGIGTIPSEIRRNLAHMQSLDKGYIHILQELRDREDDYLSRAHDAIFKLPVEFAKSEDENKGKDNHEDAYSYAHENENENENENEDNHEDHSNANKSAAPPTKRRKVESGDWKDTDTDIDTTSDSVKKDVHVDVDMKMDKHRKQSGGKEGDKDSDCDSGDDDDDDDHNNNNDSACEPKHEQGNKFWCNIKAGIPIPIPIPKIIPSLESKDNKEGDDNNNSNNDNNDESQNGQPTKASESNQQQPMPTTTPTPTPTPTSTELIIPTKEELRQQFHDPAALLQIAILRRDARQISEEKLSNANLTYQIVNDAIQTLTKDINQFEEILKATGQYVYEATPIPGAGSGSGSGASGSASGSASGGGASGSSSGARSASRSGSTGAGAGSSRNAGKLAAIQVPNSQDWILAKVIDHDAGTGMYNLSDEDFESNKSKSHVFVICYLLFVICSLICYLFECLTL